MTNKQTKVIEGMGYGLPPLSRRELLTRGGAGFGAVALAGLLETHPIASAGPLAGVSGSPLGPKLPHFQTKAKSVIFLFMEGGPSHVDLFDPKPLLNKLDGQPFPQSFKASSTVKRGKDFDPRIMGSPRKWKQYGECGRWVSDWLPHITECVDDLSVIHSCCTDAVNHAGAVVQMNTGRAIGGRPSLGSWVTYGLGSENEDLPAYVVISDNDLKKMFRGARNWHAGFMPAVYQGTRLYSGSTPIRNLDAPAGISNSRQQSKLDLLHAMNQRHAEPRAYEDELDARIRAYELAFRMQAAAPEAIDLSEETEETKQLYGMDEDHTAVFGRNCLLGRRLVERGVRFVQLYHGTRSGWDSHDNMETQHPPMCRSSDKPVAGLLKDLKRRGLLDETLVVWGGEFGRAPIRQINIGREGKGRTHNPTGFTMWMAGGGVQGGRTIGATDELGLHAIEDRLHVLDLHSTILYLLGLDVTKLTYIHQGRPERANANIGRAYKKIT